MAEPCARCGRIGLSAGGIFSDGRLCSSCYRTAIRTQGRCSDCGFERLIPGRNNNAEPVCVDCAGIDKNFYCQQCNREGALSNGICDHCRLRQQLDSLTEGPIDLGPLIDQFCSVERADSVLIWLRKHHAQQMISDLATGAINLTHDGLDTIQTRHAADYLREVLVVADLLEPRDLALARYDRWVNERLDEHFPQPADRQIVEQFIRWKQRRHLETQAANGPLRSSQTNAATQVLRVVGQLCSHLRTINSSITTITQADLDQWLATGPTTRLRIRTFITWANQTRTLNRTIQMPKERRGTSSTLDHSHRITAIHHLLEKDSGPLNIRCIGLLVCVWGQTISRCVKLPQTALSYHQDQWHIQLGTDPSPIPDAIAPTFFELATSDQNRRLHNRNSPWLFPGRRTGTHLTSAWAREALKPLIGDILAARNSALRQLVTDCPPPIVADMIGYQHKVTTHHAAKAGSPWLTYAATRSQ